MSCNLLLVEDDAFSRRNISLYLQHAGHTVYQTDNGEAALDLMAGVEFDIVISDLRLPGAVNGLDILTHHAAHAPGKRLILVTAFGSEDVRADAEKLGAHYYEKPLSLDDLLKSVETHL